MADDVCNCPVKTQSIATGSSSERGKKKKQKQPFLPVTSEGFWAFSNRHLSSVSQVNQSGAANFYFMGIFTTFPPSLDRLILSAFKWVA